MNKYLRELKDFLLDRRYWWKRINTLLKNQ